MLVAPKIRPGGPTDVGGRPRADDGIRTRDPHLGKVMRYQLRYVRMPSAGRSTARAPKKTLADPQTALQPVKSVRHSWKVLTP
jgi:hypothetical protein